MDYKQKTLDELTEEINSRKEEIDGIKERIKRSVIFYQHHGLSMNDSYVKNAIDSEYKLIDYMQKVIDGYQMIIDGIINGTIKVAKPE